jgi:D-amino peptidase
VVVTGDDAAVAEVKESVPAVRTVAVKRAINMRAVELRPLQQARLDIQQAAREGVAAAKKSPPQRPGPYRVTLRYRNFTFPEVVTAFEEIESVAPDTVTFSRETMPEAYRLIRVLYRFINPD